MTEFVLIASLRQRLALTGLGVATGAAFALATGDASAIWFIGRITAFSALAAPVSARLIVGEDDARVLVMARWERFGARRGSWRGVEVRTGHLGWRSVWLVHFDGRSARVPWLGDWPLFRDPSLDAKVAAVRRAVVGEPAPSDGGPS